MSALILAAFPGSACAQPGPGKSPSSGEAVDIGSIEIGLGGYYKVGEWTALRVEVTPREAMQVRLAVRAPDPDDLWSRFTGPIVSLSPGVPQRLETIFRTGRVLGPVQIQLLDVENRILASQSLRAENATDAALRPAWRIDRPRHVIVGPSALAGASTVPPDDGAESERIGAVEIVRLRHVEELPGDWRALQSAESLVLVTGSVKPGEPSPLGGVTDQTSRLLQEWVTMGGHLVISVGTAADEFRQSPLAGWVPIAIQGKTGYRQLIGLESYAGGASPLKFSGAVTGAQIGPVSEKHVLAKEVNGPIAVRVPYGFGRVTLLALDFDRSPLAGWSVMPALFAKLVGAPPPPAQSEARQQNRQLSQLGMSDLASQFQSAQEDFAAIRRPSHWWVMGTILLYILIIGPLDYLIVHRWLGRPEWTWATFPLLAAGAAGFAVWNGDRFNGDRAQLTQFDLLDFDTATSQVRGRTWLSVYSPRAERFDISVRPNAGFPGGRPPGGEPAGRSEARLCWLGFPENTVGGVYRSGSVNLGRHGYQFAPDSGAVHDFPISKWSTKSLAASWDATVSKAIAESTLASAGAGNLTGAVTHHLPFVLEDCLLAVAGWAYLPTSKDATLPPHAEWQPTGPLARQRDLKALLTGARTRRHQKSKTESELLTTTEVYDPQSHDLSRLVPMITFHAVAGGTQYTGLHNAAMRELELTNLMNSGRAVLIGRARPTVSQIEVNGEAHESAQHETWVRLVLPVKFVQTAVPDELMKPK